MPDPRVVLVTGASGALGTVLADAFQSRGDIVVRHARQQGAGDVWGDLTSDEGVRRIIQTIVSDRGPIDVIVNNAADQMIGEADPADPARWLAMLDATLLSAVRIVLAALPHMPSGSAIVNVSSIEASLAFPGRGPYAAAKSALEAFTRSLAVDLGARGIRANAIAPGLIERDGLAESWPEGHASWSTLVKMIYGLAADPVLLIAAQPTRGVDVGSIEFIHSQIVAARDRGAAVLLVSAELDEILGLSDRIAVMYDGRLVDVFDAADADRGRIGRLMAGGEK